MYKICSLLKDPRRVITEVLCRLLIWLPDTLYLKMRYRLIMGRPLRLDNPQTYNEKINWLKIYDRNPLYTALADKTFVKDHVAGIIGDEYTIPTLGVWNRFDDIDFNSLPDKFVLKSSNGGGGTGVIICRNKAHFDKEGAKKKLESSMKTDSRISREWVYEGIKPRIIAESIIENSDGSDLVDYKFHCFNGEPKLLFMASDRYLGKDTLKFDWYDINLNHLPFKSKGYENSETRLVHFEGFDDMVDIARKLSSGIPYVRIDLYNVDGKIYFGEYTFFHDAGFVPLEPEEWEYKIGEMITLPTKRSR